MNLHRRSAHTTCMTTELEQFQMSTQKTLLHMARNRTSYSAISPRSKSPDNIASDITYDASPCLESRLYHWMQWYQWKCHCRALDPSAQGRVVGKLLTAPHFEHWCGVPPVKDHSAETSTQVSHRNKLPLTAEAFLARS